MGKLKCLVLCYLIIGCSSISVFGAEGCLVGNTLYTSQNGNSGSLLYYDNGIFASTTNATGYCIKNGTTSGSCRLRFFNLFTLSWQYGSFGQSGDFGDVRPTYCPLDDFIWFLLIPFVGLGFYCTRKQQLSISVENSTLN